MDKQINFQIGQYWLKQWDTHTCILLHLYSIDLDFREVQYYLYFSDSNGCIDQWCTQNELRSWIQLESAHNMHLAELVAEVKGRMLASLWSSE